jgi:hypothetical protein
LKAGCVGDKVAIMHKENISQTIINRHDTCLEYIFPMTLALNIGGVAISERLYTNDTALSGVGSRWAARPIPQLHDLYHLLTAPSPCTSFSCGPARLTNGGDSIGGPGPRREVASSSSLTPT